MLPPGMLVKRRIILYSIASLRITSRDVTVELNAGIII